MQVESRLPKSLPYGMLREDFGSLNPLMEQSFDWLLGEAHKKHIRTIDGRVRRCASQESNAVWYSLRLGLADPRTEELAARLMKWLASPFSWPRTRLLLSADTSSNAMADAWT